MPRLTGRYAMIDQLLAEGVKHVFGNPGTTEQAFMDALQEYPQLAVHPRPPRGRRHRRRRRLRPGLAAGPRSCSCTSCPASATRWACSTTPTARARRWSSTPASTPSAAPPRSRSWPATSSASPSPSPSGRSRRRTPPRSPCSCAAPSRWRWSRRAARCSSPCRRTSWTRRRTSRSRPPTCTDTPRPARPRGDRARRRSLLAEAKSPVIIVGDGVSISGGQAGARPAGGGAGRARPRHLLPPSCPSRRSTRSTPGSLERRLGADAQGPARAADVIFAIGTPVLTLLFPLDEPPFPPNAKSSTSTSTPGRSARTGRSTIGVLADPRLAMADLLAALEARVDRRTAEAARAPRRGGRSRWRPALMQALDASAQARWDSVPDERRPHDVGDRRRHAPGHGPLRRVDHLRRLPHALPPLRRHGPPLPRDRRRPRPRHAQPRSASSWRGRTGPSSPIIGDGAALYTIQALWTAAHHKIPVTWVIANNRSYRILKLNMLDYLGEGAAGRKFVEMDITDPPLDFSQIAASFGVKGVRIEHPDQIGDALREAQTCGRAAPAGRRDRRRRPFALALAADALATCPSATSAR